MKGYSRIDVVNANQINNYLSKGWEIIETTKEGYGDGSGTYLNYHVGYPVSKHLQELIEIIREYEKLGFKEELFKSKAEEFGENLDDYDTAGFFNVNTNLTDFLKKYEKIVNGKDVDYFKKSNPEIEW